jgi:hypothetical protein
MTVVEIMPTPSRKAPPAAAFLESGTPPHNLRKVEELAAFDACVEACDALATHSSYAQSSVRRDAVTGLLDCSVLVSPDGDLLLLPQENVSSISSSNSNNSNTNPTDPDKTTVALSEGMTVNEPTKDVDQTTAVSSKSSSMTTTTTTTSTTTSSNNTTNQALLSFMMNGMDNDYEAAIFMGNDLTSEVHVNGFSCRGWSMPATSLALRQTEQALRDMATFCEELIWSKKEAAARASHACDTLRTTHHPTIPNSSSTTTTNDSTAGRPPALPPMFTTGATSGSAFGNARAMLGGAAGGGIRRRSGNHNNPHPNGAAAPSDWEEILWFSDADKIGFEVTPRRVGPLLNPGGTLHTATIAVEQYYSFSAESDASRWTHAATKGLLPALQQACQDAAVRMSRREQALYEMQLRVQGCEDHLRLCKEEAKRRWNLVHEAEECVTRLVEERMLQRSRLREQKRLEQFVHQHQAEQVERERTNSVGGTTSEEIWDIVSAVTDSMEEGSFEPMNLSQASMTTPRDVSQGSTANTGSDAGSNSNNSNIYNSVDNGHANAMTASPPAAAPTLSPAPTLSDEDMLPVVSRSEIEQECRLPQLRADAMVAVEAVEDASGALLNVLSNLDTTRRSARIAAETCLLSATNAQAKCLRSLIALERESMDERSRALEDMERLLSHVDVRADLNTYVQQDKKDRGGMARMGDDDDGGIASALAILSSHVDGNMGLGPVSKISTEGWNPAVEEVQPFATPDALEDAVQVLFEENDLLLEFKETSQVDDTHSSEAKAAKKELENTIQLLCKTAAETSQSARSRRSTICYALNSKRSSNAEIKTVVQFDALCRLFYAVLSGCDCEPGGVSNAKMCMMLAQTFYLNQSPGGTQKGGDGMLSPVREARSKRIFVRSRLMDHPLWSNDEFWYVSIVANTFFGLFCSLVLIISGISRRDQALYQCVSESLTHSGVMANFERGTFRATSRSEWTESQKLKWHDLTLKERAEAASQVHAVVFAQLGALAHSMMELGCGLERSCAFVRRMAIRNQLPLTQRTMLLQHLVRGQNQSD